MSTITSLGTTDSGSTSRTTINTNFTNLNTDKIEIGGANGTPVRGDLITGQNASPTWEKLALGASGRILRSDGTDVAWATLATAGIQAQDAFLDDIAALTDPDADRLLFWDDSAGAVAWLTAGSGLTITDTTITSSGGLSASADETITGAWSFQKTSSSQTWNFQAEGYPVIDIAGYGNAVDVSGQLYLKKARGTIASPTTVQADNDVGLIQVYGHDGTGFIEAAKILFEVDGTPGTNDMPGRIGFYTTADGASSSTEHMRISQDGGINMYNLISTTSSTDVNIDGNNELHKVTSSKRFKDDIGRLHIDSAKVFDLNVCSFTWNKYSGDPGLRDFGLIAEEVHEVLPELVAYDSDGKPFSVKYKMLSVLLLQEVKKLRAAIHDQRNTTT